MSQQEFEFSVIKTDGGYIVSTSSTNTAYKRAIVTRESGVRNALKLWLETVNDAKEELNEG